MPVRIYEIAKKLNLENKVVLAKAKDLGIAGARVASSSLDKITAEYLEQQLTPASFDHTPPPPEEVPPVTIIPVPEPVSDHTPQVEVELNDDTYSDDESESAPFLEDVSSEISSPEIPSESHVTSEYVDPSPFPPQTPPSNQPNAVDSPSAVTDTGSKGSSMESSAPPEEAIAPAPPSVAAPALSAGPAPAPASAMIEKVTEGVESSDASGTAPPQPNLASAPQPPAVSGPPKVQIGQKVGFIDLGNFVRRGAERGKQPPPKEKENEKEKEKERPRDDRRPAQPGGQGSMGRPQGGQGGQGGQRPGYNQGPGGGHQGQNRGFMGQGRAGGPQQQRPAPGSGRPAQPPKFQLPADAPTIIMRPPIGVRELAEKMGKRPFQIIADLMQMGVFATVTKVIETDVATRLCEKHGIRFDIERRDKAAHNVMIPQREVVKLDEDDKPEDLRPRPPVITIMGHVDHGKTTLLDRIRTSDVVSGEAGGITQHIGAYSIIYPHPERKDELMQLTFLDTPGHAAFSAMRARGAHVTDIVILVVAANDGVMPQTLEALAHAQAAGVPIIVAVNKCDHPGANPMKVRQQLQDRGLVPDDWGGSTLYVDCSAINGKGVDKLIEAILLQAELLELKANPARKAKGNVIESGVEPGGPVATVLVRKGTLRVGDVILCGEYSGRVRAMMVEDGSRLKEAGPSQAVRVLGLNGVPEAGSEFSAVDNDKAARELTRERGELRKKSELDGLRPRRQTLEDIFGQISDLTAKVLKVIVKADTQGSVEAICDALRKIDSKNVSLEIIHSAVGAISASDVVLAASADAVILGFHSRVDTSAAETAKREGVQIRLYAIIYELIDQVKEAMAGLLDPLIREVVVGQAEVRKVFSLSKGGHVAGCLVTSGKLLRGKMRVRRGANIIYEGVSVTLKRFQDEVNEVRTGMECGVRLEAFDEFEEGDIIECYTQEKVAQKLQ